MKTCRSFVLFFLAAVLTGHLARADSHDQPREGGLTGTGIVGVITELGSIIVNGQRVTFDAEMVISTPLGPSTAANLRPGDTVAVAVSARGPDWKAEDMVQTHQLIGPVSALRSDGFSVLGTDVVVPSAVTDISDGDWVAVSGLWQGRRLAASRVLPIDPQPVAQVQGAYATPAEGEVLRIGLTELRGMTPEHAHDGDVIRAVGQPVDGGLQVSELQLGLFRKPVDLVLVEGYLSDVAPSGHYTVLGTGVSSFTDGAGGQMPHGPVRLCGYQGRIVTDAVGGDADRVMQRLGCLP